MYFPKYIKIIIMTNSVSSIILQNINRRILQEYCAVTYSSLTDQNLLTEYKECKSVKNEIGKFLKILSKYDIQEETKQAILEEYLLEMIPPGTKGVIRGNKFNKIVQDKIIQLNLDPTMFDVAFERKCEDHPTSEIPDWYILEKSTKKTIIGMNQLDLWGGGHQINRASKYIVNDPFENQNCKLVCVVCNQIQFKSEKNKAFKMFEVGFHKDTICYMNNLENIIREYFQITNDSIVPSTLVSKSI
jgi:hypothetical protein